MIRSLRKILILFSFLIISTVLIIYVVSKTDKTITKVNIVSNDGLVYISKQGLINRLSKLRSTEWFDVDQDSIEKYFYSIKGVDYTLVKKVWPSTLVIYVYDYKPVAYWNNDQILLENMEIIKPEVFSSDRDLPHIVSTNETNRDYVYVTYQKLDAFAKEHNLSILKILYQGNQFSILLSNEMLVILGSDRLRSRLDLFFDNYQKVKDYKKVKYFDMRYSNGFAIKYN